MSCRAHNAVSVSAGWIGLPPRHVTFDNCIHSISCNGLPQQHSIKQYTIVQVLTIRCSYTLWSYNYIHANYPCNCTYIVMQFVYAHLQTFMDSYLASSCTYTFVFYGINGTPHYSSLFSTHTHTNTHTNACNYTPVCRMCAECVLNVCRMCAEWHAIITTS